MKIKNIILITLLLIGIGCFSSCDNFLDKEPSKGTHRPIEKIEQLEALLENYKIFYVEENNTAIATDDFALTTEIHDAKRTAFESYVLEHIFWDEKSTQMLPSLWEGEFEKIFIANLVLANLSEVEGGEKQKANLKAEAHFIRAYSYFQLALSYTLYYTGENGDELGLPIKQSVSFEENGERTSLSKTWEFIDNDLQEAHKLTTPLVKNGKRTTWRASTASVNALSARYHLYKGEYEKALSSAEAVLAEYSTMKDYNTSMYYSPNDDQFVINSSTNPETIIVKYPYTKLEFFFSNGFHELFEWEELLYARTVTNLTSWYIPSQELLDTYAADVPNGEKENDLRYKYYMCEDFSLRTCNLDPAFRYPGYTQFHFTDIISGPTVGEMLLIKAESQARQGNWQEAMQTLVPLRKARLEESAYEELTANSSADALTKIMQERRRELPFTARWYDLKRLNNNSDPSDDITVKRTFYQYTGSTVLENDAPIEYKLSPDSRHYAMPIPEIELGRARGTLKQNSY